MANFFPGTAPDDLCPCGAGEVYSACHGKADKPAPPPIVEVDNRPVSGAIRTGNSALGGPVGPGTQRLPVNNVHAGGVNFGNYPNQGQMLADEEPKSYKTGFILSLIGTLSIIFAVLIARSEQNWDVMANADQLTGNLMALVLTLLIGWVLTFVGFWVSFGQALVKRNRRKLLSILGMILPLVALFLQYQTWMHFVRFFENLGV